MSDHLPSTDQQLPLIVIVGPTASGKTGLAIRLAQELGGEIICADSRTVYTGMDIGTAKPTPLERQLVPHWGLDVVDLGQRFTAAQFQAYALARITDIRSRGKIPFLVGGTGLYIDAVLFDYQFPKPIAPERARELEACSPEQLQKYCVENNILLPENSQNKRHLIRAIAHQAHTDQKSVSSMPSAIVVGIATDRTVLRTRIEARSEQLFANGVVEEATLLGKKYGWTSEAMTGNIYPLVHRYLEGTMTKQEMVEKFTTLDRQLAKRQMTWFRRNPYIEWCTLTEARDYVFNRVAPE